MKCSAPACCCNEFTTQGAPLHHRIPLMNTSKANVPQDGDQVAFPVDEHRQHLVSDANNKESALRLVAHCASLFYAALCCAALCCAQVDALVKELRGQGQDLDILNAIGRGAHGAVFRGRWRNQEVAVKTVLFQVGRAALHRAASLVLGWGQEALQSEPRP